MFGFLNGIPWYFKALGIAILLGGATAFGYIKGSAKADLEIAEYAAKANAQVAELEKKNNEISSNVVTEYVDRWNVVKEKEYVNVNAAKNSVPNSGVVSNGWVYLHDVSAKNGDADAARASDAATSGVKDNQALAVVVSNYARCTQTNNQLMQLQRWIEDNRAAVDKINRENGYDK